MTLSCNTNLGKSFFLLSVPQVATGVNVGNVGGEVTEASGLAASQLHPGVLYTHNDSGDLPRIYAINAADGTVLATLEISPVKVGDWEDVAVGPCSGGARGHGLPNKRATGPFCIYIADTGDSDPGPLNTIYQVPELATIQDQTLAPVSKLMFRYVVLLELEKGCS